MVGLLQTDLLLSPFVENFTVSYLLRPISCDGLWFHVILIQNLDPRVLVVIVLRKHDYLSHLSLL